MSIKDIFINEMDAQPCFFCKFTKPKTCQNCKDEIESFISDLSMKNELEKAKNELRKISTDYVFVFEPTQNLCRKVVNIESDKASDVIFLQNVASYIRNSIYSDGQARNIYYYVMKKSKNEDEDEGKNVKEIKSLNELQNEIDNSYAPIVKATSDLFNEIDAKNKVQYQNLDDKLRKKGRFLRIIFILDTLHEDFLYKEYKRVADLFKSGNRNYEAVVSNFLFVNPNIEMDDRVKQFKQSAYYGQLTDIPLDFSYLNPTNELTFLWAINDFTKNELETMSADILTKSIGNLLENPEVKNFLENFDEGFKLAKERFRSLVKDIHFFEFCEDYALSKVLKENIQKNLPGYKIPPETFESLAKLFNDESSKSIFNVIQKQKQYIAEYIKTVNQYDEKLFAKIKRKNSEYWITKIAYLKKQLKEWDMFCEKINNIDTLINQVNVLFTEYAKEVEKY